MLPRTLKSRKARHLVGLLLLCVVLGVRRSRRRLVRFVLFCALYSLGVGCKLCQALYLPLQLLGPSHQKTRGPIAPSSPSDPKEFPEVTLSLRKRHSIESFVCGLQKTETRQLCISFSSVHFLVFYHLGACEALRRAFGQQLWAAGFTFAGQGWGAVLAAALACEVPPELLERELGNICAQISRTAWGPVDRLSHLMDKLLRKILPHDAHRIAGKRLVVGLTAVEDVHAFSNRLLTAFDSREELIAAVMASAYVPVLYEAPVLLRTKATPTADPSFSEGRGEEERKQHDGGPSSVEAEPYLGMAGGITQHAIRPRWMERVLVISTVPGGEDSVEGGSCGISPTVRHEGFSWRLDWGLPEGTGMGSTASDLKKQGRKDAERWIASLEMAAHTLSEDRDRTGSESKLSSNFPANPVSDNELESDPWAAFDVKSWLDVIEIRRATASDAATIPYWPV